MSAQRVQNGVQMGAKYSLNGCKMAPWMPPGGVWHPWGALGGPSLIFERFWRPIWVPFGAQVGIKITPKRGPEVMSKTLQKKDTKISLKWPNMGPKTPPKRGPKSCKTGPGNRPKSDLVPRALPDPPGTPFWGGFWCPGPPPGAPGEPQIVDMGAILEAQIVATGACPGSNFHPKSVHT